MNATLTERMTLAAFRELPDDPEVDRMLLRGRLVEQPRLYHTKWHGKAAAAVAGILGQWRCSLPEAAGDVFAGDVGCDLPEINTAVGIDVAYFSDEVLKSQPPEASYLIGPPVLAVEILSPSDMIETIRDKVRDYLAAGVRLVWVIDPEFHTVTVHRPDARTELFAEGQEVSGDPHLPGLRFLVDELFE